MGGARGFELLRAPQLLSGYDLDSNRVLLPPHIRYLAPRAKKRWMDEHGFVPAIEGGAYSMFEAAQPWGMMADAPAITAAAEAIISQPSVMTLPPNFFSFPGKVLWLHANGILSSPVTTPGTFTFRLRKGTGVVGDVLLIASGACAPDNVAHTNAQFFIDLWLKCIAMGQLTTSLQLQIHGKVSLSSSDNTLAAKQAEYMPAGNAAQAAVTGLDGITAANQTLTLTGQPSLTTGSISLRDVWLTAMN